MNHAEAVAAPGKPRMLWLALGMLLAVPMMVYFFLAPDRNQVAADVQTFSTAVGETRMLRLDDGSEIRLQGNSSVAVRYSEQQRRVQLTRGEATLVVAPDSVRPFWAQAGTLRLRADVSAFSLRLNQESVMLQVLEGSVRAQSGGGVQTLNAGERVVLELRP